MSDPWALFICGPGPGTPTNHRIAPLWRAEGWHSFASASSRSPDHNCPTAASVAAGHPPAGTPADGGRGGRQAGPRDRVLGAAGAHPSRRWRHPGCAVAAGTSAGPWTNRNTTFGCSSVTDPRMASLPPIRRSPHIRKRRARATGTGIPHGPAPVPAWITTSRSAGHHINHHMW